MRHPAASLLLTAGGVASMTAALVFAAPGDGRFPISTADVEARHAEVFTTADTNGDGRIDIEEFIAFEPHREHAAHMPHGGPRPGHGAPPERMADFDEEVFAVLDANGDGVIAVEEFSTARLRDARKDVMKRTAFERLDANADGYLAPDEFPPARLVELDTDGDGKITRDEMRSARPDHN